MIFSPRKIVFTVLFLIIAVNLPCISQVSSQDLPIVLSNIELVTVDEDSATITWVTNLPANTAVRWGETEELGEEVILEESTLYHLASISSLKLNTMYYYQVGSNDRWGGISSFQTLSSPTSDAELELKLVVVADPHYDVDGQNTPNGYMYGESTRLLESLVDELNNEKELAFVLTEGDLTNGAEEDYSGFVEEMNKLNVPWYPLLGNHDKTFGDWYEWYKTYMGRIEPYYSFDYKGYHIVILDSAIQGQVKGDLNETQLAWLEADLNANAGIPTLIFLHHLSHRVDMMGLEEEAKNNLETILSTRPWILSVNSGHLHQNVVEENEYGQLLVTTAAVVSYPIGYSVIKLYNKGYTQSFHKIGTELETSEDSRRRINAASGNPNADEEFLGTLEDRSIVVTPPQNQPPIISFIALDPGSILIGESTIITVTANDPDSSLLEYIYETTDGTISGSGPVVTYTAPLIPGVYTIYVKVFDGEYYSEEKSIDIEVSKIPENRAPVINKVITSETTINVKETLKIEISAFDEDEDDLIYYYEPSGGVILGSGKTVEWQAPDYSGDFTIKIWVSDGELESRTEKVRITVLKKEDEDNNGSTPGFEGSGIILALLVLTFIIKWNKRWKSKVNRY